MRLIKNISFSQKAFIAFTSLFTIIIFITLGITYLESSGRLKDELSYSHTVLLRQVDQSIDTILGKIDSNAINLILNKEMSDYMNGNYSGTDEERSNLFDLNKKLAGFKNANEYISSIYIYSKNTDLFFTESGLYKRSQFYDSACIKDMDQLIGNFVWLSTRKVTDGPDAAVNARNVITLIRPFPLTAKFGPDTKSVIVINIDENVLFGIIKNAKPYRLGHIFIIDKDGKVVSHDNKSEIGRDLSEEQYIREIVTANGEGIITGKSNGVTSTIFYVNSPYTNWKYISLVPNNQINGPLVSMRNAMVWVGIVMFILANLFVLLINRWTFKPIDRFIRRVAGKIKSNGDRVNSIFGSPRDLEKMLGNILAENEKMSEQVKESLLAMKWRLATDILGGYKVDYQEVSKYFELLGISLHFQNYVVMVMDIDNKEKLSASIPERGIKLYTATLSKKAEEIVNEESRCVAIELIDGKIAVIMSFEEDSIKNIQMRILSASDMIKSFMDQCFNVTLSAGVGHMYKNFEDIPKSYKEADEALKYRIVMGNNSTIFSEEVCNFNNKELYRIYHMTDDISECIKCGDTAKLVGVISHTFKEIVACNLPPEIIRQICTHLVMQSVKLMLDSGVDEEEITKGQNLYDRISQFDTLEGLHSFLKELLIKLSQTLAEKKKNKGNNEFINNIVEYIKQNYTNSGLSLSEVADRFNISVPYLSKIFKEQMDCNFVDYLIAIRMERAKQLLTDSRNKINEIGEEVGYMNYFSFTRIFKKYTGTAPGEFRNQVVCERAFETPKK